MEQMVVLIIIEKIFKNNGQFMPQYNNTTTTLQRTKARFTLSLNNNKAFTLGEAYLSLSRQRPKTTERNERGVFNRPLVERKKIETIFFSTRGKELVTLNKPTNIGIPKEY